MLPHLPAAVGDFLTAWNHDAPLRWSESDFAAQSAFVNAQINVPEWLDWTNELAAMQLLQAAWLDTPSGETTDAHDLIIVAGPVAELLAPDALFQLAMRHLKEGGRFAGIIPCVRDNSPASQQFIARVTETLWPYYTMEELLEMAREAGLEPQPDVTAFHAVPQFTEVARNDAFRFKGFRDVFQHLAQQGYDPAEVGWGELRLVANHYR